eukprot:gene8982-6451_t
MSIPQASLLSQITGITFAGEDDPRLQTHAKDLCDDFRLDALRLEAAAESRLLEEVDRIRQQFCAPMESIDYHYRLLATDHSLRSSPAYFVGGQPSQTLELKFHQTAASAPAVVDEDGPAAVAAAINVPMLNEGPDAMPNPPTTTTTDEDANLPPAPLQRSRSLQEEFACCISRVQQELTVTIALRTAIKRLYPEYGPAVDTMSASTVAASLAGGVDLRGSLEVVCRHLGLRYVKESTQSVKFVLSDTTVERSFLHANLPFRRLLEDSRMVHPVYAEGVVEQRKQLFMRMVADEDTPCHSITSIPAAIVDTLMRPLLVKAGPYRDWINAEHGRFQSALATVTGIVWEPLESTIAFDQWLPRRLLQKLCRRAGCPMETSLALMELRTELRKFLEALLTSPFVLLPVFDCLAYPKLGEAKRQVVAIEAAPLEVQQAVECMGADVASTWRRRILELKREHRQRPMFPLFTHETMFALCDQVMHGLGVPTMLTTEAIDLLATVSESFMVSVVRDAYLLALQAKRYVLEPSDIQMARRLRGERA